MGAEVGGIERQSRFKGWALRGKRGRSPRGCGLAEQERSPSSLEEKGGCQCFITYRKRAGLH